MLKSASITLTPEWDENWLALTRLLELGEGFQLIFVFTDEHQTVDLLREQLLKQFTFAMTATPASDQLYHDVVQGLSTLIDSPHSLPLIDSPYPSSLIDSLYSPPPLKKGGGGGF